MIAPSSTWSIIWFRLAPAPLFSGLRTRCHVIAEVADYVDGVIGGGVVEHKNAIVALRQYLWDEVPKTIPHIEVRNGRNNR